MLTPTLPPITLQSPPAPPTPSPIEMLVKSFAQHEQREREALRDYHDSAKKHDNPLVRYLLGMLIADEEKHHDMIRKVTAALEADLAWDPHVEPVPKLGRLSPKERAELSKLADELIAEEKRGIADYKKLLKTSEGYYGGIITLLLETVIHDSEKHLMILRFLKKRLRKPAFE